jgi:uncharacterized protein (TIGR02646 family)
LIYIEKSQPAPTSLVVEKSKKSGTYRTQEVIDRVSADFHDKCYICESVKPNGINVEHFVPHHNNRDLMFDWNNLFYSCVHCNSVKGDKYNDILNCTKLEDDVENRLNYSFEVFPKFKVSVNAVVNDDNRAMNTSNLLNEVYTGHTPEQRKVASYIVDRIKDEIKNFRAVLLRYLCDKRSDDAERIRIELSASSAFAAFKRQIIKDSPDLFAAFEDSF